MYITSLQTTPEQQVSHNPLISKQVMLKYGTFPPLTNFSQARFPPREIAHTHKHDDMLEVFFIQQGHGEILINDTVYKIKPGDCIAVEPGEVHELRNVSEIETLVVTYLGIHINNAGTL
jgi:mannose-6-phosphate isomerase-like protein (cupin superfamily)